MNIRRIFFLLVILGLVFLFKPKATMSEAQRVWSQRDWILYVLVTAVGIYLIYGLYGLYLRSESLW